MTKPLQWNCPPPLEIRNSLIISCADKDIQLSAVLFATAVGTAMRGTEFPDFSFSKRDTTAFFPLLGTQEGKQFVAVAAAMAAAMDSHDSGIVLRHILDEMPGTDGSTTDGKVDKAMMPTAGQWEKLVDLLWREANPTLTENSHPNPTRFDMLLVNNDRPSKALSRLATTFGDQVTVKTTLDGPVNFELPLGTTGWVMKGKGSLQEYVVKVLVPDQDHE